MHSKSYSEHLREAQYCGLEWRLLRIKPEIDSELAETLPHFRVIRARCNSKACPHCSRIYYRKLRKRFRNVSNFKHWRMFTLTTIKTDNTRTADLQKMESNFRELRKQLQRKNKHFKYLAVRELSPSGMWHIHGLWNQYIDIKELSNIWEKISGAYRVHLSAVRSPNKALNYIFKYCFKSIFNDEERRELYEADKRKFSTSKGLLSAADNKSPYTADFGIQYSVDSLKEELYNIIAHSNFSIDDFISLDYPYFDDLTFNLFSKFYEHHPPDLFDSRIESLGT